MLESSSKSVEANIHGDDSSNDSSSNDDAKAEATKDDTKTDDTKTDDTKTDDTKTDDTKDDTKTDDTKTDDTKTDDTKTDDTKTDDTKTDDTKTDDTKTDDTKTDDTKDDTKTDDTKDDTKTDDTKDDTKTDDTKTDDTKTDDTKGKHEGDGKDDGNDDGKDCDNDDGKDDDKDDDNDDGKDDDNDDGKDNDNDDGKDCEHKKLQHLLETIGMLDEVSTTASGPSSIKLSETVGIQDKVDTTISGSTSVQLSETLGIADSASLTTPGGITSVQLSETVGISHRLSVTTPTGTITSVHLSETLGIQDKVDTTISGSTSVQLSETVGISHRLSVTTPTGTITSVQLSETLGIADSASLTTPGGMTPVQLSEAIGIEDGLVTFVTSSPPGPPPNPGPGPSTGGGGGTSTSGGHGGGGPGRVAILSGGFGPKLNATVQILEISYDVCKQNMVRIVVGIDDYGLPSVKIRTSVKGVITTQLSAEQPFKEQNKITKIDRFVFEAPLAPSEKFFIVTAQDVTGKSRTTQEQVSIIGCEGTIRPAQADSSLDANLRLDMQHGITEGALFRATAYLSNHARVPLFGIISLVVDDKTVYVSPQTAFNPGTFPVKLEWTTPKVNHIASYQVKAKAEIHGVTFVTDSLKLYTLPSMRMFSLAEPEEIKSILDEMGNPLAKPSILHSSFESKESLGYRVIAPDGTCVIGGSGCLVKESTSGHRGNLVTVSLKDQIYRVRYSGTDDPLEWFTITSPKPILGKWDVELESEIEIAQPAYAMDNVFLEVKYRLLK